LNVGRNSFENVTSEIVRIFELAAKPGIDILV